MGDKAEVTRDALEKLIADTVEKALTKGNAERDARIDDLFKEVKGAAHADKVKASREKSSSDYQQMTIIQRSKALKAAMFGGRALQQIKNADSAEGFRLGKAELFASLVPL